MVSANTVSVSNDILMNTEYGSNAISAAADHYAAVNGARGGESSPRIAVIDRRVPRA